MMWWVLLCASMIATSSSGVASAPAPSSDALAQYAPLDFIQMGSSSPEEDNMGFAMQTSSNRRYALEGAPWIYYLAAEPKDAQEALSGRAKRRMSSLSIDLPMAVLRQKLSLDNERKVQTLRAAANRDLLNVIGKRGFVRAAVNEAERY